MLVCPKKESFVITNSTVNSIVCASMIPEPLRTPSLQPGTSISPLLPPGFSPNSPGVPIFGSDGDLWGVLTQENFDKCRNYKAWKYSKSDRTKRLIFRSNHEESFSSLCNTDDENAPTCWITSSQLKTCQVTRRVANLIGAKQTRFAVVAFCLIERQYHLLMAKRLPTAIENPTKYQTLLDSALEGSTICREELGEIGYRDFGLQPELFQKLRSAGIVCTMTAVSGGIQRVSTHVYDLDFTGINLSPNPKPPIQFYEVVPVKTVLDWAQAGLISTQAIPVIADFCVRRGIITPETDDSYLSLVRALHNDLSNPYDFRK